MEFKVGDWVLIPETADPDISDGWVGKVHAIDGEQIGVEVDFGSDSCKCCGTVLPEDIRMVWAKENELIMVQPVEFERKGI